jgi:hypothetical protein
MSYSLDVILDLVGQLDDSPGEDTARERFRTFLDREVDSVGHLRDLIEESLRRSGTQSARALQDLVNYAGHFLGFEVEHGRYQGVPGKIGHDGLWRSPTGFSIVIETKTTENFHIKTSALTGYVDALISEQRIPDWDQAMGLYVIGNPDPEVKQLRNAIVAESRTDQLRTVSIEALLSLAELLSEYDVNHEDALAVVRPSGPSIDPIANLMARVVAQEQVRQTAAQADTEDQGSSQSETEDSRAGMQEAAHVESPPSAERTCWLTPVSDKGSMSSRDVIYHLVAEEQVYGYGKRTPGRRDLAPGDRISFYASGEGVVAHAEVATVPEKKDNPGDHLPTPDADEFPYIFQLRNPVLYLDDPVVIDEDLRAQLDAFEGRDLDKAWSWFVQSSREVSAHDFKVLTRG